MENTKNKSEIEINKCEINNSDEFFNNIYDVKSRNLADLKVVLEYYKKYFWNSKTTDIKIIRNIIESGIGEFDIYLKDVDVAKKMLQWYKIIKCFLPKINYYCINEIDLIYAVDKWTFIERAINNLKLTMITKSDKYIIFNWLRKYENRVLFIENFGIKRYIYLLADIIITFDFKLNTDFDFLDIVKYYCENFSANEFKFLDKINVPLKNGNINCNDLNEIKKSICDIDSLSIINVENNNDLKVVIIFIYFCSNLKKIRISNSIICRTDEIMKISGIDFARFKSKFSSKFKNLMFTYFRNVDIVDICTLRSILNFCENIEYIGLSDVRFINTPENLSGLFSNLKKLKEVEGLTIFDSFKIKNISSIFSGCMSLESLNGLQNWNTHNLISINSAFRDCLKLVSLKELSNWDVSNVNDMESAFSGCCSLKSLDDLICWNTNSVTNMNSMFSGCKSLESLIFNARWNFYNVKSMSNMFSFCSSIKEVYFYNNLMRYIESVSNMFYKCTSLEKFYLKNCSIKNYHNGNKNSSFYINNVFEECNNLRTVHIENLEIDRISEIRNIFYWCNLKNFYLKGFYSKEIDVVNNLFRSCNNLNVHFEDVKIIDCCGLNDMFILCKNLNVFLKNIFIKTLNRTKPGSIFYNCIDVFKTTWDNVEIDTVNIVDDKNVFFFYNCSGLVGIDLSSLKINKISSLSGLFYCCKNLEYITGLCNINTSFSTNFSSAFYECFSLKTIKGLDSFNTSNVENLSFMFYECFNLVTLPDISNWNTHNVKSMEYMFSGCSSLLALPDISKWETYNVKRMDRMFNGCVNLSSLPDISKWDIHNVCNMSFMFCDCRSLTTPISIGNSNINNFLDMTSMFKNCISLSAVIKMDKRLQNVYNSSPDVNDGCISFLCPNLEK